MRLGSIARLALARQNGSRVNQVSNFRLLLPSLFDVSPKRGLAIDRGQHGHSHSHGQHGHSHATPVPASKQVPIITKTAPMRPWLEPPVDLTAITFDEAKTLWEGFGGASEELSPTEDYVQKVAEKAFQLAVATLTSARTVEDLEETRSLLATAAAHGSERARLYCAWLFMVGQWPVSLDDSSAAADDESDQRTAKEKGMEVIRQIRAIQKKRKKGERYDSKPPKDLGQSLSIIRSLAQNAKDMEIRGNALLELGDAHFFPDEDLDEDLPSLVPAQEALKAYETAAKECQTRGAWYRLGSALMEGSETSNPDQARAVECFERAVEMEDDADAHFFLGHLSRDTNPASAKRHLLRAAEEHDHSQAMVYLARWAMEESNDDEAKAWLLRAERLGDAEAVHLLADCFHSGSLGFEKDLQKALRYYKMAGAAGSAEALLSAGAMHYEMGEFEDAFKCYESAAEGLGSVDAWRRMADLYMTGKGVRENHDTAKRIFELVGKPE